MVNQAETGVIQLNGRGYVNKPRGGYAPGEFARLFNCELTDYGSIRRRNGIVAAEISPNSYTNLRRFIGTWGDYAIYGPRLGQFTSQGFRFDTVAFGGRRQINAPDLESTKIYNPDGTLLVDANTYTNTFDSKNWHPFVHEGFVRYNGVNYWISAGVLTMVNNVPAYTYQNAVITVSKRNDGGIDRYEVDQTIQPTSTAWDTKVVDTISVVADALDSQSVLPKVVNGGYAWNVITHFIHKDRLWIVTPTKVLFSKSTDPTEWRVSQDGGFISMADANITYAVPNGDNIYIFSDNKIDVLTYTDSPNTDGAVTRISQAMGADSACEMNNQIYFCKYDALYSIVGNRISKVMDLNLNVETGTVNVSGRSGCSKYYRITAWYDYLIVGVVARAYGQVNPAGENVLGLNKNSPYFAGYSAMYVPWTDLTVRADSLGAKVPTCFFMINSNTGAVSELGYNPSQTNRKWSAIQEVAVMRNENSENQQTLFITAMDSSTDIGVKGLSNGKMSYHLMYPPTYSNATTSLSQFDHSFVTVDGWPDGNNANMKVGTTYSEFALRDVAPEKQEYNIKRFRSLECEAFIGQRGLLYQFSYDGGPLVPADGNVGNPLGPSSNVQPPVALRVGMNQRARAVNIRIVDDPDYVNNLAYWEIYDLRLLWTYTSRGPSKRSGSTLM